MSAPQRSSVGDYHFVTRWHLQASCDEVRAILDDAEGLARWWPSVYLEVKVIERVTALRRSAMSSPYGRRGFCPTRCGGCSA
jgi:hypothetical protein